MNHRGAAWLAAGLSGVSLTTVLWFAGLVGTYRERVDALVEQARTREAAIERLAKIEANLEWLTLRTTRLEQMTP